MEVLRLRSAGSAELQYASEELGKNQENVTPEAVKQEALVKAVKRLNEEKLQLSSENKHLREELDALLFKSAKKSKKGNEIHGV